MLRHLVLPLLATAAAVPSAAGAQGSAGAPPVVPALAATLEACATGLQAPDRRATFAGAMAATDGTARLSMRFTLQQRRAKAWRTTRAPTFGRWLRAKPGADGFVFEKTITRLEPGTDYRASIRFRWSDARGVVLRERTRRTPVCAQSDLRPDLVVTSIAPGAPGTDGLVPYAVTVANRGETAASRPWALRLRLGEGLPYEQAAGPLAAGATAVHVIRAPACTPGQRLSAEVDARRVVDEADEAANALAVGC